MILTDGTSTQSILGTPQVPKKERSAKKRSRPSLIAGSPVRGVERVTGIEKLNGIISTSHKTTKTHGVTHTWKRRV